MEVKDLYPFVYTLIVVGLVLGVGVLVFYNFGHAVKDSTNIYTENVTLTAGSGTTSNDDVTAILGLHNYTGTNAQTTNFGNGTINFTLGGTIEVAAPFASEEFIVLNYTYLRDSAATDTMDNMESAVTPIASTWIPLIVTVGALAIVLLLVIRSFGSYGRK